MGAGATGPLSLVRGGGAGALFLFLRGICRGVDSDPLLDVRESGRAAAKSVVLSLSEVSWNMDIGRIVPFCFRGVVVASTSTWGGILRLCDRFGEET